KFGWGDLMYGPFYAAGPAIYAQYMVALITLGAALWMFRRRVLPVPLLAVLMCACLFCLMQTLSRTGILALAASSIALVVAARGFRWHIVMLCVGLALTGYFLEPAALQDRVEAAIQGTPGPSEWNGYDYTVWRRLDLARLGRDELLD